MKKILKEPLIHFLLIGAFLFVIFQLVDDSSNDSQIIVDQYDINEISAKWELQIGGSPTKIELEGLVTSNIREEIYYREGMAMNLDHNDEIIRRRIAKKMEFLTEGVAESSKPTNENLEKYYKKNIKKYRTPDLFTFHHIYFSSDIRTDPKSDAEDYLNKLIAPANVGDPFPFSLEYTEVSSTKVSKIFGSDFSNALLKSKKLGWQGPIKSGFGYHVVNITDHQRGKYPPLVDIHNKVLTDYTYDLQVQLNNELFLEFKKKYTITYELDEMP